MATVPLFDGFNGVFIDFYGLWVHRICVFLNKTLILTSIDANFCQKMIEEGQFVIFFLAKNGHSTTFLSFYGVLYRLLWSLSSEVKYCRTKPSFWRQLTSIFVKKWSKKCNLSISFLKFYVLDLKWLKNGTN